MKTREERLKVKETAPIEYKNFRRNLRLLRASVDISAVELSEKLGLKSGVRCVNLEYGRADKPTLTEVDMISKYFKISIDELLNKEVHLFFK